MVKYWKINLFFKIIIIQRLQSHELPTQVRRQHMYFLMEPISFQLPVVAK